ncbi:MAG: alpha/beta fold hydrolase [Actinomycetota bacterium]
MVDQLTLSDARIAFETHGRPAAPALVFSHGILMDRTMFEPQIHDLARDYFCITWDERGHGDTTQQGSWTYWDSAHDLIALLDHLDVSEAVLVGMSQGGFLSLRCALTAPGHVRALVMIDSQAGPEPEHLAPIYKAMLERWLAEGGGDIVDSTAAVILGPAESSTWKAMWLARERSWVVEPFKTLMQREDIHDRLREIGCPTVVIHGSLDAAISLELANRLCEGLPGCTGVVVVDGAGHASNLSHPARVTAEIRSFLERL